MNIGIKHDFLYINTCWDTRVVLVPEPERGDFQQLQGSVVAQCLTRDGGGGLEPHWRHCVVPLSKTH